jgi:hypothetical protein
MVKPMIASHAANTAIINGHLFQLANGLSTILTRQPTMGLNVTVKFFQERLK